MKRKIDVLWRYGKPVIRECMDEIFPDRGSGHYGCGLYAFRETKYPDDRLKIDVSDLNFYYTETSKDLNEMINFSKEMNKIARGWGSHRHESLDYLYENDWLPKIPDQSIGVTPKEIKDAIQKSKDCLGDEIKDKFHCSPPINNLLIGKGFDGVIPLSEEGNQFNRGSVVFKETVEKIIGQSTQKKEEFEL